MRPPLNIARALASAFLSGPWHLRVLLARGDSTLGNGGDWLRRIAISVMQRFPSPPVDDIDRLAHFIARHQSFYWAWMRDELPASAVRVVPIPPAVMGPMPWPAPVLPTLGDLASWFGITASELAWFADERSLNGEAPLPVRHYFHQWITRGPAVPRLLEAPKPRLKALQRQLLEQVISRVPTHDAAHGFVRGRSVRTHAAVHVGQRVVMRFDLRNFFTFVTAARSLGVFRSMGYPYPVARAMIALCTTETPADVLSVAPLPEPATQASLNLRFLHTRALRTRHLPQGAPTSPALANLAAFGLDVRCAGFAASRGLRYSRYADDLVFSGDIKSPGAISEVVRAIAADESFVLNPSKTRSMHAGVRQMVTGVVVNERLNVSRDEFDRLKALFHRCRTAGPASLGDPTEVRARLLGLLSWVRSLNLRKATRLERDFRAAFP